MNRSGLPDPGAGDLTWSAGRKFTMPPKLVPVDNGRIERHWRRGAFV